MFFRPEHALDTHKKCNFAVVKEILTDVHLNHKSQDARIYQAIEN